MVTTAQNNWLHGPWFKPEIKGGKLTTYLTKCGDIFRRLKSRPAVQIAKILLNAMPFSYD